MLEHPPAGYPGRAHLLPWGIPAPQGIGSPARVGFTHPGGCPPASVTLSPPHCLTANAAESKEQTNKKNPTGLEKDAREMPKLGFL